MRFLFYMMTVLSQFFEIFCVGMTKDLLGALKAVCF